MRNGLTENGACATLESSESLASGIFDNGRKPEKRKLGEEESTHLELLQRIPGW